MKNCEECTFSFTIIIHFCIGNLYVIIIYLEEYITLGLKVDYYHEFSSIEI